MISGIYAIVSPSGKYYVGSTIRFARRRTKHFCELKRQEHHCTGLQRAYNKYEGQLYFHILEHCGIDKLQEREQFWIDLLKPFGLYNSRMDANIATALSEETKRRISISKMGKLKSEQTKMRMRKPKSPEHAAAISAGKRGKAANFSPEGIERKRASMARAQIALAAKRLSTKQRAHMQMLAWVLNS